MNLLSCFSDGNGGTGPGSAATFDCAGPIFQNVVQGLLMFAGVAALIFIAFSGIKMMLHGSDAKKIEEDKKSLQFAILGLILILISFFIINVIAYITGAHCITKFGFEVCP